MKSTNDRKPILYPKHLNLYVQCPERYYHERVARKRPEGLLEEEPDSHQLGKPSSPMPSSPRRRTANSVVDSSGR